MTTVAIMQPYFSPYAGYFRLMEAADIFVLYDCVQFPRRGRIHRNEFTTLDNRLDWLTLPIKKADYHAKICQLEFDSAAPAELRERARRFKINGDALTTCLPNFYDCSDSVVSYLENSLRSQMQAVRIESKLIRSSSLPVPSDAVGQHRIIAICELLGADRYVNVSGGSDLYEKSVFDGFGIDLRILTRYQGSMEPLIERISLGQTPQSIRDEIIENLAFM